MSLRKMTEYCQGRGAPYQIIVHKGNSTIIRGRKEDLSKKVEWAMGGKLPSDSLPNIRKKYKL